MAVSRAKCRIAAQRDKKHHCSRWIKLNQQKAATLWSACMLLEVTGLLWLGRDPVSQDWQLRYLLLCLWTEWADRTPHEDTWRSGISANKSNYIAFCYKEIPCSDASLTLCQSNNGIPPTSISESGCGHCYSMCEGFSEWMLFCTSASCTRLESIKQEQRASSLLTSSLLHWDTQLIFKKQSLARQHEDCRVGKKAGLTPLVHPAWLRPPYAIF